LPRAAARISAVDIFARSAGADRVGGGAAGGAADGVPLPADLPRAAARMSAVLSFCPAAGGLGDSGLAGAAPF
jgi:hypothetical protein